MPMPIPTSLQTVLSKFKINLTPTPGAPTSTPVNPGTIVNTSGSSTWDSIPTPVKLIGAGLLAFVGYKKFLAPKKSAGVNGLRGLFGSRRRRRR